MGCCTTAISSRNRSDLPDDFIARIYALTEPEFTHILSTFPLVAEETKAAALATYRVTTSA
jgi:hypothetical protein